MRVTPIVQATVIAILAAFLCRAGVPVWDGEVRLHEKYDPLTEYSLMLALHDSDDSVRGSAALWLAGGGYKDSLPAILETLDRETVPGQRMTIALAAARLGSERGIGVLKQYCGNLNESGVLRVLAARDLTYVKRYDCFPDVMNVLRNPEDRPTLDLALNVLTSFKAIPPDGVIEIREICARLLSSVEMYIRVRAAELLGRLGDSSSLSVLRSALDHEQDDMVRGTIEKILTPHSNPQDPN